MSKSSHTPGPWKVRRKSPSWVAWEGGDAPFTVAAEDGRVIARGCEQEASDANARLISSAPDLLAALERIASITGSTGGAKSMVDEFQHIARVAIARAKGGAS